MKSLEMSFQPGVNMENRYSQENLLLLVPESEFRFESFLSSGPGGQNVQKNESGVRLRWSPDSSASLSGEEKTLIISRFRNEKDMAERLARRGERFDFQFTKRGELLIAARHDMRQQEQNKKHVIEKFYMLLEEALRPEPKRKPLRKPSPERRLEGKRRRSETLRNRQSRGESE